MKRIFTDYRCWKVDVIREAIEYLEKLIEEIQSKEDGNNYINKPYTIIVEVVDENEPKV